MYLHLSGHIKNKLSVIKLKPNSFWRRDRETDRYGCLHRTKLPQKRYWNLAQSIRKQLWKNVIACFSSRSFIKVYMIIYKTPHQIYRTSVPYNIATFKTLLRIRLFWRCSSKIHQKNIVYLSKLVYAEKCQMFRICF